MIGSFFSWGLLFLSFGLATVLGVVASRGLPWTKEAQVAGIPSAFGIALGPFVFSFGALIAILLPDSLSDWNRVALISAVYGSMLLIVLGQLHISAKPRWRTQRTNCRASHLGAAALLAFCCGALILCAVLLPITQNDALEYATVGRILYNTQSLASYPPINPSETDSGFFGPWTHPPLYVLSIYYTFLLQAGSHHLDFMTLIAPWFAICGVKLVFAIGLLESRKIAYISAAVFASTPLFFLGAAGGLIDALPILGLALLLASIIGIDAREPKRAIISGAALGLALWTHSQAVLFVGLYVAVVFSYWGCTRIVQATKESLVAVAVALILAGWPYLNNVITFGSVISDSPAVLNLDHLDWAGYFASGRGLNIMAAKIQYGVLKGWFAYEAYGLTFWFAGFGTLVLVWGSRKKLCTIVCDGIYHARVSTLHAVCTVIFSCYLAGTILSICLGYDHVIKNERYLLGVLAPVSLLAGLGGAKVVSGLETAASRLNDLRLICFRGGWVRKTPLVTLYVAVILQISTLSVFSFRTERIPLSESLGSSSELRMRSASFRAMKFLQENAKGEEKVLTLKPADMFFAERKMISYLDTRLIPFYNTSVAAEGYELLKGLDVNFIHLPDYGIPVFYNSVLMEIVGNPQYADLAFSEDGYQIYRLKKESNPVDEIPVLIGSDTWQSERMLVIGGRKALETLVMSTRDYVIGNLSLARSVLGLFHRDFSTSLASPEFYLEPNSEYRAIVNLSGEGFVRVWLSSSEMHCQETCDGGKVNELLGEFVLQHNRQRNFVRRFIVGEVERKASLRVEHVGNSDVTLYGIDLHELR
ncbi:MAG: hypothetical protein JJ960_18365 [Kordiimonadaceae bacterium]|nr:hypothetical protein [Kordiimonadaceae bacterium]